MKMDEIVTILNNKYEDDEPELVREYDDGYVFSLKQDRDRKIPLFTSHVRYVYKDSGLIDEVYIRDLRKKRLIRHFI